MKMIYRKKGVPNEFLGKWRSIEFEMILNDEATARKFAAFVEEKGYDRFVTIKDDGSIERNDYHGVEREVVVSYCSGREEIVHDICKWLRGNAYVNRSCGTHVHFDMRGVELDRVNLYGKRLASCVQALKQLLPKSRRNNEYCGRECNTIDDYNRYAFVNMTAYQKYKTIEVRAHSGTLNASKILNWIKICEKIMLHGAAKTKLTKPEQLIEHYKFGKYLADYVNNRVKQVNPPAEPAPAAVRTRDCDGALFPLYYAELDRRAAGWNG